MHAAAAKADNDDNNNNKDDEDDDMHNNTLTRPFSVDGVKCLNVGHRYMLQYTELWR